MGSTEPNGSSLNPRLSEDGLAIAFESAADNLAEDDPGIGVLAGKRILCADVSASIQNPQIPPTIDFIGRGRDIPAVEADRVCYRRIISTGNQESAIYGFDLGGTTPGEFLISQASESTSISVGWVLDAPDMSNAGDRVVFSSDATDLRPEGEIENAHQDVYVWFGDTP